MSKSPARSAWLGDIVSIIVEAASASNVYLHDPQWSQLGAAHDTVDLKGDRKKSCPHCFHDEQVFPLRQLSQYVPLGGVAGGGFFNENVLSCV